MEKIDLIIEAEFILPMAAEASVLKNHALAIHQGKIIAIEPYATLQKTYQAKEWVQRPHHILLPGFINAHTHIPMNLFRGLADDYPLMTWLHEHIWPAEKEHLNEDFIRDGSLLAIAEMIRGGTTCFNDHFFFHDTIAETTLSTGLRATVGLCVAEFPTAWAQDATDYLKKAETTLKQGSPSDLITYAMAPHSIYAVSEQTLQKCKSLARTFHTPIHIHVHETKVEVEESLAKTGKRPLRRLHELGLLDSHLIAVHMTQINEEDIALLKETQAHVVHSPQCNMKLASGICPVERLHREGINIAIGTDGVASNNDLNMIEEMRTAAFLAKVVSENAAAIPAHTVLRMGSYQGAKALGLEKKIGTLEIGKEADLISIDCDQIELLPLYHPHAQLIYAANRENVNDVWVQGKMLLKNRELTSLDEEKIKHIGRSWGEKIKK
ncbi:MAG: hypothetical protein ACD_44C00152G0003 [uncultured bacterium]|nr:MAG: hypothetical protein ACD_44C00152G0003 [uncultured bacterium]OGT75266.1 MAG: N-ethylammeline chlorohydrolase [Gammaproteobacteria bacterium RIFCSPLOWO2_12_FULL_38_14]